MKAILICVTIALWCVANAASAVVKWTDENGTVHYSDQAPAGYQSKQIPISFGGQSTSTPSSLDVPSKPRSVNDKEVSKVKTNDKANIDNVDAVPYLTLAGRAGYREFLSHPSPRAFLVCPDGSFATMYVVGNHQDKLDKMLNERSSNCEPYVVNDSVVWKGK